MNIQKTPISFHLNQALGAPIPTSYLEQFCGLTEWQCTSDDPPPFIGWWKTYTGSSYSTQRRFWNGLVWSAPVYPWMAGHVVNNQLWTRAQNSSRIIWCGLKRPHLAGYLEPLLKSDKLRRLELTQHTENKQ